MSLGSCVRGVMTRDTRGVALSDADRLNYFPASPLCSISWWFHGHGEIVRGPFPRRAARPDDPRETIGPAIVLGGPSSQPMATWSPGPTSGMMLLLMPDALRLLTGLEPAALLDKLTDVRETLPPDWVTMCEAVATDADDAARLRRIQDFIEPRWDAVRPKQALHAHRYQDWAQGLLLRAGQTAVGSSLRQVERRIKLWTGQPMRELQGLGRSERAFFEVKAMPDTTAPKWADVAASAGFSDQSHLTRATRRMTGFTPADLYRRIRDEEAFWAYRVWM